MSNRFIRSVMRTTSLYNPALLLRIGVGLCFIAHGVLAFTAKAKFVELLGSFGISGNDAIAVLKVIGLQDIFLGLMILFRPTKWVLIWGMTWIGGTIVAWGIHGDSMMDLLRRSTYFAAPAALLSMLFYSESKKITIDSEDLEFTETPLSISSVTKGSHHLIGSFINL